MSNQGEENTQEVVNSLQIPNSDTKNLSKIVCEYGDVDGTQAMLIQSVYETLEAIVQEEHFGGSLGPHKTSPIIQLCGIRLLLEGVFEVGDINYLGVREPAQCIINVLKIDEFSAWCHDIPNVEGAIEPKSVFNAANFREMAKSIVDSCYHRKICSCCTKLFQGMDGFTVCRKCCLTEHQEECSCKRKFGTVYKTGDNFEHADCKRRRLMKEE